MRIETASSHGVHLHKVLSEDAQEVRLYCFSEERAAKERGIVERFAKRFDVEKIRAALSSKRLAPSWKTTRTHVRNLKTRANPNAERNCPKCGQPMVLRTVRRGANTGDRFWGCSGFPKCRMVQELT